MTRVMLVAALLWALALPLAAQDDQVQELRLDWTPGAWRVTTSRASGAVNCSEPDLFPPDLPDGTLYFVIYGSDSRPVIARGFLTDPGRAVLDPEEDGTTRPFRSAEAELARASTVLRIPAEPAAATFAIFRSHVTAAPETVFEGPVGAGASLSGGPGAQAMGAALAPNRIGVLFAGDGFLREDFEGAEHGFLPAVEDARRLILEVPPFDAYQHLFTFAYVKTESTFDGVSIEDQPDVDTYFGTHLLHARRGGQLIADGGNPKGFSRRVVELTEPGWTRLLALAPGQRRDITFLLINDPFRTTGLSLWQGAPVAFGASTLGNQPERCVHQLGHVLGRLGDEHTSTPPFCRPGESAHPNVDPRSDRSVAWGELIDAGAVGSPVPGGQGCGSGWFHPTAGCVMNSDILQLTGFCAVCREALLDGMYSRVSLIDAREPADPAPVFETPIPPRFRITANATPRQTIAAEWILDGRAFPANAQSASYEFSPAPALWTPGRHVVRFAIADRTPLDSARPLCPRLHSMPHEARWDVTVRDARPAALTRIGDALAARR